MPRISLTPDAEQVLKSYTWPGNIRQLKNITEQIALIERARVIDDKTLKLYLPYEGGLVPVNGTNSNGGGDANFANEREILYKVLFDMKNDMNEMKKLVHNLMQRQGIRKEEIIPNNDVEHEYIIPQEEEIVTHPRPMKFHGVSKNIDQHEQIITPEEIIEETFSLEEREKETILKALKKNAGKRKQTAVDLGISERTLYRKLKDYNIE